MLFHLHICFRWDAVLGLGNVPAGKLGGRLEGTGINHETFIGAKALIVVLAVVLQKPAVFIVRFCFSFVRKREKPKRGHRRRRHISPLLRLMPWVVATVVVGISLIFSLMLTSKGLFESTKSPTEGGAPCGCQGIAATGERDWLELIFLITAYRTFIFRPLYILVAVLLHFGVSRCEVGPPPNENGRAGWNPKLEMGREGEHKDGGGGGRCAAFRNYMHGHLFRGKGYFLGENATIDWHCNPMAQSSSNLALEMQPTSSGARTTSAGSSMLGRSMSGSSMSGRRISSRHISSRHISGSVRGRPKGSPRDSKVVDIPDCRGHADGLRVEAEGGIRSGTVATLTSTQSFIIDDIAETMAEGDERESKNTSRGGTVGAHKGGDGGDGEDGANEADGVDGCVDGADGGVDGGAHMIEFVGGGEGKRGTGSFMMDTVDETDDDETAIGGHVQKDTVDDVDYGHGRVHVQVQEQEQDHEHEAGLENGKDDEAEEKFEQDGATGGAFRPAREDRAKRAWSSSHADANSDDWFVARASRDRTGSASQRQQGRRRMKKRISWTGGEAQ